MPAFQPITILDGATTPVAHIFSPKGGIDAAGVARYRESTGIPLADPTMSTSTRTTNGKVKSRLVLAKPAVVEETINGVTRAKVERPAFAETTFTFSESSTLQERKDLRVMMANAILHADIATMIDDVESMF